MVELSNSIRLAADIGGTFTDVILEVGTKHFTAKVPTTIQNPEQGILTGVKVVLGKASLVPKDIDIFIHGTTLATNALIERKGAKTALITTEGFRDSLEIAYESRFDQFDLLIDKPQQLIPRDLRFTIRERMNVHGDALIELDDAAMPDLCKHLIDHDVDAVAIGLLHSYANPNHERRIRDALLKQGCRAEISISSEVCPEVREYERLMTTSCNAYIQPLMTRYLRALEEVFHQMGADCPIFLMTSGGGMTTLENAIKYPIRLVESGPSGGAVLAAKIARDLKEEKVLAFDMGGTTAKISLIEEYTPKTARDFEIARSARFQKGSGMPVRIPVIEMIEIGAGGGSIAHVDGVGRLNIGPESAGAVPGAACYGKGGTRPTVTDANLVLGRINPEAFAEGKMRLDIKASKTAIDRDVGVHLQTSTEESACGIIEMVEENMANAARIHSVEHGVDLSEFTMIAFGGGGPLHATRLAEKLGINRVIIPANSSVGSALGFLNAPIAYEVVQSGYMTLNAFDAEKANDLIRKISDEAHMIVGRGEQERRRAESRTAFMRYTGQGHEIQVSLPCRELKPDDLTEIKKEYDRCYSQLFGRTIPERDIEILSWSVVVSSKMQNQELINTEYDTNDLDSSSNRDVYLPGINKTMKIPTYWRPNFESGAQIIGPALLEEPQTTTFIASGFRGHLDGQLNFIMERSTL